MNNWISTIDRLPEYGKMVILYSPQLGQSPFCGCFYNDRWYYSRYFKPVHESNEITHWQPLPIPPQTIENDTIPNS